MSITYDDICRVNSEIKMTDIGRGKEYAEVPQKVAAFRKLFPMGTITTEIISLENGVGVMKATASIDGIILGDGIAYEKEGSSFINKTSFIENCQTSAVGRALAFLGIGSEASIASFEEVMNAKAQQKKMTEDELKAELKTLLMQTDSDTNAFLAWCTKTFEREIKAVDEMYDLELKEAIKMVKRKERK